MLCGSAGGAVLVIRGRDFMGCASLSLVDLVLVVVLVLGRLVCQRCAAKHHGGRCGPLKRERQHQQTTD